MFKNRELKVQMVKKNANETEAVVYEVPFDRKVAIVSHFLEKAFHKAAVAALAYVVLDTARQVILTKVNDEK